MKVAIVHDWLVVSGGAEKVLKNLIAVFPDADLFTLVDFLPDEERDFLGRRQVKTSFIQNLPFAKSRYRSYLSLFPLAIEQFDLTGYDLVVSSSYAAAKGVITGPDQLHLCYCHSPARYAWDMQFSYLKQAGLDRGFKGLVAKLQLHYFRIWDARTAAGVDYFVANSDFIRRRINKCYRREAEVIFPPVCVAGSDLNLQPRDDFYLTASRMVPYKRMDLVVQAFATMPNRKLVVIGDGPESARIASLATPNISLLGYQPDAVLRDHMRRAKAFVFAAEEDFGIIPVEAQAFGTPVIAYGKGGSLETVKPNVSGLHFTEQTVEAVVAAVNGFESGRAFDPAMVRSHAEQFSERAFQDKIRQAVANMQSRA